MLPQYPPEQLQRLLEKLPKELLDTIYSEQTAETIGNICEQYGIEDERASDIAKYAGQVLVGLLLPSGFEDAIRKNVELPEVLVKAISSEINRFIFYPVKASLEQIHKQVGAKETEKGAVEIPTPRHSDRDDYVVQPEPAQSSESVEADEDRKGPDTYREPIE